jgi:hypothetical protein
MRRRCGASDPEHFAAVHLAPLGRVDQREKGLLIGVKRKYSVRAVTGAVDRLIEINDLVPSRADYPGKWSPSLHI